MRDMSICGRRFADSNCPMYEPEQNTRSPN